MLIASSVLTLYEDGYYDGAFDDRSVNGTLSSLWLAKTAFRYR